jgi:FG-GAP-like repeat
MKKTVFLVVVVALPLVGLLAWAFGLFGHAGAFVQKSEPPPVLEWPPELAEASSEQVHALCARCHKYPPADSFPRAAWRKEVKQGYEFLRNSALRLDYPPLESVALYYEKRAPEGLPRALPTADPGPAPVRFERHGYRHPQAPPNPGVTNVNLVHLSDDRKLDVLVCDTRAGQVLLLKPYEDPPNWRVLGKVVAPAHAEVVDLDGDGRKDVVVACLGSFYPTDDRVGSVVWLRGEADGSFTPITLLEGVGRTADVQVADFNGDGKLDLVVAVFGWRNTGAILYLENQTTDWSQPKFVPHVVDDRHGTIHVPVADLNGDGRPDFVALISQEHEAVVAFLNEGEGRFRKETLWEAPHPAWGSSGIQLVDLDGDGNIDVLMTNGDTLDYPYLLKPYHGVQWLENPGTGKFPWVHHPLTPLYGVMRAVAADLDGDGRKDVIAVSYLPFEEFPERAELKLDSVILLHQTAPGRFERYSLEKEKCDHVTCAAGDWNGDGKLHLVTGNLTLTSANTINDAVTLWKNVGR